MMLGLSESTSARLISMRRPYSLMPSPRRTSPMAVRMMPDALLSRRAPRASRSVEVRSCCLARPATRAPVARAFSMAAANSAFGGRNTKVFARVSRVELGEFDALVLGLLLMAQFRGQVIGAYWFDT
jgi:hypothetical protein